MNVQARLHEELALREKALRDTRIRNIHEVEELKRAQDIRIDEFSRHELRESHATIQELTSQIQELQERMNFMNDSREFQDVEVICSGKLSHVPRQSAIVPSLGGMLSRDQSLRLDTWNLLGTSGNVFDSPRAVIDSSQIPCKELFTLRIKVLQVETPVQRSTGRLAAKGEEQTGSTIPMPIFTRRPSTMKFSLLRKYHRIRWMISKYCKSRSFIWTNSPTLSTFFMLEDKIQNPGNFLFWFSLGGYVMDQRSGDGRFGG